MGGGGGRKITSILFHWRSCTLCFKIQNYKLWATFEYFMFTAKHKKILVNGGSQADCKAVGLKNCVIKSHVASTAVP